MHPPTSVLTKEWIEFFTLVVVGIVGIWGRIDAWRATQQRKEVKQKLDEVTERTAEKLSALHAASEQTRKVAENTLKIVDGPLGLALKKTADALRDVSEIRGTQEDKDKLKAADVASQDHTNAMAVSDAQAAESALKEQAMNKPKQ